MVPAEPISKESAKVVKLPKSEKVKNPAAVALGKLGGSKGGRIRAEKLTAERRKEIARKAATARWAKIEAEED